MSYGDLFELYLLECSIWAVATLAVVVIGGPIAIYCAWRSKRAEDAAWMDMGGEEK